MAEGWTRHLKGDQIEACSAGIEPRGLDRYAVKVMAEAGVDISRQRSKRIDQIKDKRFNYVVTVCDDARPQCPYFPARVKVVHVGFDDPPRLAAQVKTERDVIACYRRVRDQIRAFVETLPRVLDEMAAGGESLSENK
jgi:arsenate reductase